MAKGGAFTGGAEVGDKVLIIGLVAIGGLLIYMTWQTSQLAIKAGGAISNVGTWTGGGLEYWAEEGLEKAEGGVGWLQTGWNKVTGAPEWAWRETIGSGGLNITGSKGFMGIGDGKGWL